MASPASATAKVGEGLLKQLGLRPEPAVRPNKMDTVSEGNMPISVNDGAQLLIIHMTLTSL